MNVRSVTDVGPGDYVKLRGGQWEQILSNSAYGIEPLPKQWTIVTATGSYGMFDIRLYAKAEDLQR